MKMKKVLSKKISTQPHSKFLVCGDDIDHVLGYVDSKELLTRVLNGHSLNLHDGVNIRNALIIPDTLTLSDTLESFKNSGEDFAVILNEYALVMGIITINDVMTTLMGDLIGQGQEEQIVVRDENSWLVEGERQLKIFNASWISMNSQIAVITKLSLVF